MRMIVRRAPEEATTSILHGKTNLPVSPVVGIGNGTRLLVIFSK
jgi:hypothetical protein